MNPRVSDESLRDTVRRRYGARALEVIQVESGPAQGTPSAACCTGDSCDPITSQLYSLEEVNEIPEDAFRASLGCGNPTALAALEPGEIVLDLGSGGGIDVLLAAKRVGPSGFVYGLDMTEEMLALAERNKQSQGAANVAFLKGEIEAIPLPANTVDTIISNCVVNLSADKSQVLREAFRVLKPGGRLAISDVVVQGTLPASVRADQEAWVGCIAGALEDDEYRGLLTAAGFEAIDLQVTRVYDAEKLASAAGCCGAETNGLDAFEGGRLVSAFVQARKPRPA